MLNEDYKIIKNIRDDDKKQISIIELDNKKYILKKVKNSDANLINMLINEVNILHALESSNISPKFYKSNISDTDNYIIIELIKGKPIYQLKFEDNRQKISFMLKLCAAIKKIHECGIVHCDLKPDNIMLDTNNEIKIIDFGIALHDNKFIFKGYGNISYCSKYQLLNSDLDYSTDIYSLVIIFYRLMMGKLPFEGTNKEIKEKKINGIYEESENTLLNLIFSKAFQENKRKYMNIQELENDLKLFLL